MPRENANGSKRWAVITQSSVSTGTTSILLLLMSLKILSRDGSENDSLGENEFVFLILSSKIKTNYDRSS